MPSLRPFHVVVRDLVKIISSIVIMQTIDPINRSKETGGDGVKKKRKKEKKKQNRKKKKETEINEIHWGSKGNQVDNPTWFDATLDQP